MEQWKTWILAIVTVLIEAILIYLGRADLIPGVTAGVVAIINAIFGLIILFIPATVSIAYMRYQVEHTKAISGKK